MKKTLFSLELVCALGFTITARADDGETGHGQPRLHADGGESETVPR